MTVHSTHSSWVFGACPHVVTVRQGGKDPSEEWLEQVREGWSSVFMLAAAVNLVGIVGYWGWAGGTPLPWGPVAAAAAATPVGGSGGKGQVEVEVEVEVEAE